MSEERIIEIETRLAFQESTISDLNEVVCRQQDQIDRLEEVCRVLLERVQAVAETQSVEEGGDERPPHY